VSAGLIHVAPGELDAAIERGLRQIMTFLGVDRGNVDAYVEGGPGVRIAATRPDLEPLPRVMDRGETFPWASGRLRRGAMVRFDRVAELPEEAAIDAASYRRLGTRSHVSIPLRAGGRILGALSFDSTRAERAWPDELVGRLRLLSEAFASALERKRTELETQRLRQDLAHIGRISAMGELTASLAHELNQPLTAILSNAQTAERLLAGDPVDLDEIRAILRDIVDDDKRAGAVIRRLREVVRKGDLEFVSLALNDVATDVAWLVRNDAVTRNVSLVLDLAPDLPRVRGDRVQLQQVVLNLVLNGLEAMGAPHGGDRTLVIRTVRAGAGTVGLEVQDSGGGIDEARVDQMFQPLYTTKPHGLGMGLAITRTMVEAHGGRIEARNTPGGGAAFPSGPHAVGPRSHRPGA